MRIIPLVQSTVLGLCFLKHETNSVIYFIVDVEVRAVSSWFTLVFRYVPSLSFYYISDSFHLYYGFSCVSCLPCLKYLPPVTSSSPCLTGPSALCAYNLICVFVRVSVCTSRVSQRSLCSCCSFLFCFTFFLFGLCTSLDFCNSQIKDPLSLQFTWSGILSCLVNLWQSEGRLFRFWVMVSCHNNGTI